VTARRFHTFAWVEGSLTDEQWAKIEKAGQIAVSAELRQRFHAVLDEFQFCRARAAASPPARDVKNILSLIQKSLESGRAGLSRLLDAEPASELAVRELQFAFLRGGAPAPDRQEILAFCACMERVAAAASEAMKRQPRGERGQIARHWEGDLFQAADDLFRTAGGRKKLKSAYMDALCVAVGYKPHSTDSLKRKPDKARRRKRAAG
jgi:hypothetical protein